jgi:hypothetical protein
MASTRIYGATDLKTRRTELLGAAVKDRALVRAVDGTALVLLRLDRVDAQDCVATWALRLRAVEAGTVPAELGWLDVLDEEDRRLCIGELWAALQDVRDRDDRSSFDELLRSWRTTAATLEDPRRRHVLLGTFDEADFVPAERPE